MIIQLKEETCSGNNNIDLLTSMVVYQNSTDDMMKGTKVWLIVQIKYIDECSYKHFNYNLIWHKNTCGP